MHPDFRSPVFRWGAFILSADPCNDRYVEIRDTQ